MLQAIERFVAEAEEVTRLHAESNAPYPRSGSIPPELQTESAFRDVIRHRSSDVYTAINPMARIPETTEHRSLENQGSEADDRFVEIDVEGNPSKHGV